MSDPALVNPLPIHAETNMADIPLHPVDPSIMADPTEPSLQSSSTAQLPIAKADAPAEALTEESTTAHVAQAPPITESPPRSDTAAVSDTSEASPTRAAEPHQPGEAAYVFPRARPRGAFRAGSVNGRSLNEVIAAARRRSQREGLTPGWPTPAEVVATARRKSLEPSTFPRAFAAWPSAAEVLSAHQHPRTAIDPFFAVTPIAPAAISVVDMPIAANPVQALERAVEDTVAEAPAVTSVDETVSSLSPPPPGQLSTQKRRQSEVQFFTPPPPSPPSSTDSEGQGEHTVGSDFEMGEGDVNTEAIPVPKVKKNRLPRMRSAEGESHLHAMERAEGAAFHALSADPDILANDPEMVLVTPPMIASPKCQSREFSASQSEELNESGELLDSLMVDDLPTSAQADLELSGAAILLPLNGVEATTKPHSVGQVKSAGEEGEREVKGVAEQMAQYAVTLLQHMTVPVHVLSQVSLSFPRALVGWTFRVVEKLRLWKRKPAQQEQ